MVEISIGNPEQIGTSWFLY